MKTFKQAWLDRNKVIVNGEVWDACDLNVRGTEVILTRFVRVKAHHRRIGDDRASGLRLIEIRRPIDAIAQEA